MRSLAFALVPLWTVASAHSAEPGDPYAFAEALLRYEMHSSPESFDDAVCITVDGKEAPATLLARLKDTHIDVVPCSSPGMEMRIPVSGPDLRPDGTYQVVFGYYMNCSDGCLQGQMMFVFMTDDSAGWHVLRNQGGVHF